MPPIAQAKASLKGASSASRVAVDHLAQQVFRADEPATRLFNPQTASHTDLTISEAASDQHEILAKVQSQKLVPPRTNLSRLPLIESPATPMVLGSVSPAMALNDQAAAPAAAGAASDSPSAAASAPVPETQMALECALGFGPTRCAKNDCNGGIGPVETVDYLGTNEAGADLYAVKYMHRNTAYVVSRDPDGIAGHYRVKLADPYWIKRTVASHTLPKLIYTRPENSLVLSACEPYSYPRRR
jgi:hypothetical protein